MAKQRVFSESIETDVLIVGGGLVGGTLAVALDAAGLRSTVIERGDPAALLDTGFDGRASAIAHASQCMLQVLGLWDRIAPDASPILDIRVSEGGSRLFLHFDHHDAGGDPLGYMVENRVIRTAIHEKLPRLSNVRLIAPAEVASLERGPDGVEALLADGSLIHARLAVAADGRDSALRRDAGIGITGWSYAQSAIVCTVEHEHPHAHVAQEHFLPSGPFAILPLRGNRSSIVWTERSDLAPVMMELGESEFMVELGARFGDFLGRLSVVGPRWSYPLSLQFARTATARRLALVGDALHGMHPIAGQGLNMGLRDVAALAEVLCDAKRLGLDPADGAALADYERRRRFDNFVMLASTDCLTHLFSNDLRPLKGVRDLGMSLWGKIGPLKRLSMRHAMGTLGNLPRLLRGQPL